MVLLLVLLGMTGAAAAQTTLPVVERSAYSNADGVTWAASTNATATQLP